MLCAGFSVCSKQPDFDAKSYVQSSLEAVYHGTYADYALLMEISEEEIATYTEKMAEVKKLAKYKVQDIAFL